MYEEKINNIDCARCPSWILSWSFVTIVISTLVKGVLGVICGSRALVANAVSSFTDCVNIGINFVGAHINKPNQFLQSAFIASILFISGIWVCTDNAVTLISGVTAHPGFMGLVVSMLSCVVCWYFFRVSACTNKVYSGDQNISLCLLLNRSDFMVSCIAFIGILLAELDFMFIDPVCGIIIGCILVRESSEVFELTFTKHKPITPSIKQFVLLLVTIISCCIIGFYIPVVVGIINSRDIILIPSQGPQLDSPVDSVLGRGQYFTIINVKNNSMKSILNESRYFEGDVSNNLISIVKSNNVGVILAQNIGSEIYDDLRLAGIKMYYIDRTGTVMDIVSDYREGLFKSATGPNVNKGFGRSKIRWFAPW